MNYNTGENSDTLTNIASAESQSWDRIERWKGGRGISCCSVFTFALSQKTLPMFPRSFSCVFPKTTSPFPVQMLARNLGKVSDLLALLKFYAYLYTVLYLNSRIGPVLSSGVQDCLS